MQTVSRLNNAKVANALTWLCQACWQSMRFVSAYAPELPLPAVQGPQGTKSDDIRALPFDLTLGKPVAGPKAYSVEVYSPTYSRPGRPLLVVNPAACVLPDADGRYSLASEPNTFALVSDLIVALIVAAAGDWRETKVAGRVIPALIRKPHRKTHGHIKSCGFDLLRGKAHVTDANRSEIRAIVDSLGPYVWLKYIPPVKTAEPKPKPIRYVCPECSSQFLPKGDVVASAEVKCQAATCPGIMELATSRPKQSDTAPVKTVSDADRQAAIEAWRQSVGIAAEDYRPAADPTKGTDKARLTETRTDPLTGEKKTEAATIAAS